ncbi:TPA: DUF1887 family protein [Candidatus Poribacteria bacterium]|nr:DUF1887 family protein [Candidatus Poribacteria bacterium]
MNLSDPQKGVACYLHKQQCLTWDAGQISIDSEEKWKFLNGGWLEVYTFHTLKNSGLFDNVRANVVLKGSDVEHDVILTCRATLAVCECKAGASMSMIMGKLRAIKETLGGTYGRTFYVTARNKLDKRVKAVARDYGVTGIIEGPQLCNIAEIIQQNLR